MGILPVPKICMVGIWIQRSYELIRTTRHSRLSSDDKNMAALQITSGRFSGRVWLR